MPQQKAAPSPWTDNMTKKLLCNPPANRVADAGDPEVCGMFEGAGAALADLFQKLEEYPSVAGGPNYAEVLMAFQHGVVTAEANYVKARKDLAALTVAQMHARFDELMKGIGQVPYAG